MTLMEQIKAAQLTARKARNSLEASLLTTLIGEAEVIGKNDGNRASTDAEVTAVIKKFIKNIDSTIDALRDKGTDFYVNQTNEKAILERFLPRQLSEDELKQVLVSIKNEISAGHQDLGKMLALLKERFSGQYDGKMAANFARTVLAG